jgi:hypothetical protein
VGDLVNNGLDETAWNDFFSIEQDFLARVPLFPTLGNHEQLSEHYFDRFYLPHNERWYDFEYGHARFICLEMDGYANIDELSEQYQWLERRLAENTQPWTFVFFHKSPYTSEYEGPTEQYIRSKLSPLFEQYGVQIVFSGHNHNYQRSIVKNIFYIVTGGGGGELSSSIEPDEYLQTYKVAHHLVHISIDGDQLIGKAITPDGEVFDSFDIALP